MEKNLADGKAQEARETGSVKIQVPQLLDEDEEQDDVFGSSLRSRGPTAKLLDQVGRSAPLEQLLCRSQDLSKGAVCFMKAAKKHSAGSAVMEVLKRGASSISNAFGAIGGMFKKDEKNESMQ